MTEAVEIGISLALADGVLEGIARAQKDADAVTRTAGAGALSVQRLQAAGVAALTIMHSAQDVGRRVHPAGPVRATAAPASAVGSGERGDDGGAPVAPQSAPGIAAGTAALAPAVPRRAADEMQALEAGMEVIHSLRLDTRGAPVRLGAAERSMDQSEGAYGRRASPTPVRQPSALRLTDQPGPDRGAPGAPVSAPIAGAAGGAAGGGPTAPPVASLRDGRSGLRLDDVASRRPGAASVADGWAAERRSALPVVQSSSALAAAQTAPVAPVVGDVPPTRPVALDGRAPNTAEGQAAGDGSGGGGGAGGSMQGDVFLDGALVGRWMSRHLSREAGRASAGPTGFDSRRNALLPGATVGG